MRIDKVTLNEIDPLRMFTHSSAFPDRKPGEEHEEEEKGEQEEEDDRISHLFFSMVQNREEIENDLFSPISGFFKTAPNLADLAELLNRSDVQEKIKDKLRDRYHDDPVRQAQSRRIKENLDKLNGRIDRENSIWFRRIPLLARIFWQIDRIKIPKI